VFELKLRAGGTWVERILHTFKSVPGDGIAPSAGLILDASGNLYGTTYAGGSLSGGTVFELKPTAGGGWVETVLYSFSTTNGYSPSAGLVFDAVGNLYGTTINGGTFSNGTVFEVEPKKGGGWTERVLYNFDRNSGDGYGPTASLTFDQSHNLYGTTYNGGAYNGGTAFELTRTAGGAWTETIVHNFDANGVDGANPYSGLIFDGSGNLYGTATLGGVEGFGVVFELTPSGSGLWTETILHGFEENGEDGIYPGADLIIDGMGNLYGTATAGGTQTGGIVFEIKP